MWDIAAKLRGGYWRDGGRRGREHLNLHLAFYQLDGGSKKERIEDSFVSSSSFPIGNSPGGRERIDGQGKTRERTGTRGGKDHLRKVEFLVLWYMTRPSDQILEFIVG